MKINRIQNIACNKNFGAKLVIKGNTDDIDESVMAQWKSEAESIGRDKDVIKLKFGTEKSNASINTALCNDPIARDREISGSAKINGKNIYKNKDIGFAILENPENKKPAIYYVNKSVIEFFNQVK